MENVKTDSPKSHFVPHDQYASTNSADFVYVVVLIKWSILELPLFSVQTDFLLIQILYMAFFIVLNLNSIKTWHGST